MKKDRRLRYVTTRAAGGGRLRHYWQPSSKLRALGWRPRRLDDDPKIAARQAAKLNEELDRNRGPKPRDDADGGRPAGFPRGGKLKFERAMVYVAGGSRGPYKIGFSAVPFRRLATLQNASGIPLRFYLLMDCHPVAAVAVETLAHVRLAKNRQLGEWFDAPLERVIAMVLSVHLELLRKRAQLPATTTDSPPISAD